MLSAIDLHDQAPADATKIDDVWADDVLSSKSLPYQSLSAG
jgi:hypothetical protein